MFKTCILGTLLIFTSPLHGMFDYYISEPMHPVLSQAERERQEQKEYDELYNLVKSRIANKEDLNQPIPNFKTSPLHQACSKGDRYLPITQLLIDKGAALDTQDMNRHIPLHNAVTQLAVKTVTLLPKTKDDVNSLDNLHWSMLYSISTMNDEIYDGQNAINRVKIARLLLAHGARPNFQNSYMATCLHRLIAHPYSVFDTIDWFSRNPIERRELFFNQRKALIRTLLEYGASLSLCDYRGRTPIELAYLQTDHHPKNQEIYKELAQYALNYSVYLRKKLSFILGRQWQVIVPGQRFSVLPSDIVKVIVDLTYPPYIPSKQPAP